MYRRTYVTVTAILAFTTPALTEPPQFSLIDLGTLGGADSAAMAINASGHVVGEASTKQGHLHAFWTSGGALVDIGTLGGAESIGLGINDSDVVVGSAKGNDGQFHAFSWQGAIQDIGTSGVASSASAINNSGVIVGSILDAQSEVHAVIFEQTGPRDIAPNNVPADAFGVNLSGVVVGGYSFPNALDAFRFDGELHDLGFPNPYLGSEAFGINEAGEIVGKLLFLDAHYNYVQYNAFVYKDGTMKALPTPDGFYSYLYGLNSSGESVGRFDAYGEQGRGMLVVDLQIFDLNSYVDSSGTGYTITEARGINDNGQIAGTAVAPDGDWRAILLTPHYLVEPTVYTLYRGRYISGGLSDLFDSDDAYLRVYPGLVMNGFEAPVQVVVTGTARSLSHYSDLRLKLEAHVSSPNLRQTIELYDYQSGQWVNLDTTTGSSSDSVRTAIAPDPSRFVQFLTNEVKARLSWKPAGLVNAWPWTASLDQVQWTVTP